MKSSLGLVQSVVSVLISVRNDPDSPQTPCLLLIRVVLSEIVGNVAEAQVCLRQKNVMIVRLKAQIFINGRRLFYYLWLPTAREEKSNTLGQSIAYYNLSNICLLCPL